MTTTLIALPCTARELENALHAVCDHGGLWGGDVRIVIEAPVEIGGVYLAIETKGEAK